MTRESVLKLIEKHKVFAIVRGIKPEHVRPTMDALIEGGIRLVEVTFDRVNGDEQTLQALDILQQEYRDTLVFGAGTVTNVEQVKKVKNIGGMFIVSPDCNTDVIQATVEARMVSLPAALTPTEALTAHNAGADFVKLFPGGVFGPDYLKALAAPLSDIRFIAVGGVTANNIPQFAKAGAVGFGIGSNLVNNTLVENNDFNAIYQNACEFNQAIELLRK